MDSILSNAIYVPAPTPSPHKTNKRLQPANLRKREAPSPHQKNKKKLSQNTKTSTPTITKRPKKSLRSKNTIVTATKKISSPLPYRFVSPQHHKRRKHANHDHSNDHDRGHAQLRRAFLLLTLLQQRSRLHAPHREPNPKPGGEKKKNKRERDDHPRIAVCVDSSVRALNPNPVCQRD